MWEYNLVIWFSIFRHEMGFSEAISNLTDFPCSIASSCFRTMHAL
ncbi:hypothetical protein T11_17013 [Trichinella zimbabwensis]|uniref:Uncharacterized protein n=1 Tax=Trichinella zimbabwensis TaxID=268475 RepID=A0A0V1G9X6_9BILA|nr:hypothetical protein T11_17013 [Trichinella zimbabwensis]